MAAHRYWRLQIVRRVGASAQIVDVQMRSSAGGANIATGGTALASTATAGSAANVFDGNTGTSWTSNTTDPVFVGYDFGSAVTIVEILVTIGATAGTTPFAIIVCYSDDGVNYYPFASNTDVSNAALSSTTTISGFTDVVARVTGMPLRLDTAWPTGSLSGRVAARASRWDQSDVGSYRIVGTVALDDSPDIPVRRRVRVFNALTARCVAETWSDAVTGAYAVNNLKLQPYFVIAHDHTATYNAEIKDAIIPEAMP